jgi:membrane fusion protein (multidrug efflux system)
MIAGTLRSGCIICFAAGFLLLAGCEKKKESAPSGPRKAGAIPVEAIVVKTDSLQNIIYSTGSLLPNEKVELRNEVPGRITGIFFNEGSEVQKGAVLLKINDRDLQAQLNKNTVQEQMARDDEFRKKKLLEIKAISQEEYDIAANQLKSVQAEKQLLEAQIAKTEVCAPFSGKIGLRSVSPGSFIPSNTVIATLQQVDPIKIEFSVPEKYTPLVKEGMTVHFGIDYSNKDFSGRVYAVESGIDAATRTVKVRALCSNPGRLLVPGTFARISLVLENLPDAIKIPSEAIVGDISGSRVFVIRNGKAAAVPVETGIRTEKDIQITSGLQPGDSLIITGLLQVNDGMPVMVKGRSPKMNPAGQPKSNQ